MSYICPRCDSRGIMTERRPNGNSECLSCGFKDSTSSFPILKKSLPPIEKIVSSFMDKIRKNSKFSKSHYLLFEEIELTLHRVLSDAVREITSTYFLDELALKHLAQDGADDEYLKKRVHPSCFNHLMEMIKEDNLVIESEEDRRDEGCYDHPPGRSFYKKIFVLKP